MTTVVSGKLGSIGETVAALFTIILILAGVVVGSVVGLGILVEITIFSTATLGLTMALGGLAGWIGSFFVEVVEA